MVSSGSPWLFTQGRRAEWIEWVRLGTMSVEEIQAGTNTRIVLVDDHRIVREGIAAVLARESDIEVVGEASTAEEGLEKVRILLPDVVVLDLHMPGMGGLAAIRRVKEIRARTSVIVLTVENSEMILLEAVRAGAAGYVLKDASMDILVHSIRLILQGGTVIDSKLLQRALRPEMERKSSTCLNEVIEPLTPRELEVLQLLARGLDNQDIAEALGTTRVTAKKHIHHIIGKLQVSDRTQAALKAVRLGLVD
jgi:DNA-binding NarL/FixJ family response regulator